MTQDVFDLAVVGVGGMGSASLWAAAKSGLRTIGLDQFGVVHDRGSSHGQSRIIRTAYFEHPSYVPMARQAFAAWAAIEAACGKRLLETTGLLQVGLPESSVIRGVQSSAQRFDLPVERLTPAEIERRWPAFRIPSDQVGLFEQTAGVLRVEHCCANLIRLATSAGAEIRSGQFVTGWRVLDNGQIRIETSGCTVLARRMIVAAGPWTASLLSELGLQLNVVRKQQHWLQVDRADVHRAAGFCCFLLETPQGCFYGFPALDHLGMKFAEHSGGESIKDPTNFDRELNQADWKRVEEFAQAYFRFNRVRLVHFSQCMYTRSADEHFLIDLHPQFPQIAFVAGLSGHGYKFAPVIGQHLVGLLTGHPNPDCEFLRINRFGILS